MEKEDGKKFQLDHVRDINYRTEEVPTESTNINNGHKYTYDANGNLVYINTSRVNKDGREEAQRSEKKYLWDEENRLLGVDENGFVSNYWYDADGERTVKTSGENEALYVNSEFSSGRTGTTCFSLYVSPYLVTGREGHYTKHIYIGSQRIASKVGDSDSYGADPRRISYAGNEADGITIDYKGKYALQLQSIKDRYKAFEVPYHGADNNDYVYGKNFYRNDARPEAVRAHTMGEPKADNDNFKKKEKYEHMQYYYHPDHLGSSSYITNLDGEVSQHIEYVPFGEVFIEERNNTWNTPYLFNAKELDEETGLYYYGARYYDPRLSLWMSTDPLEEKRPFVSSYTYTLNNPIRFIDPTGLDEWEVDVIGNVNKVAENKHKDIFHSIDTKKNRVNSIEFKHGAIEQAYDKKTDEGFNIEVMRVRGDKNAIELFEFLTDPRSFNAKAGRNVEWSLAMTGEKGDKGLNFLTTSHNRKTEKGATDLLQNQLLGGYTIRELRHNHPSNTAYPSGLVDRSRDVGFASWVEGRSKQNVIFKIYLAKTKSYIFFDGKSQITDFPTYPSTTLPEIVISAPRTKKQRK